ncbi:hypothetical protein TKS_17200 [Burkholderia pseudomallei]|nr:hypothetical protein TKS_17200 [Burkholderia pseudomallei]
MRELRGVAARRRGKPRAQLGREPHRRRDDDQRDERARDRADAPGAAARDAGEGSGARPP